MEKQVLAAIDRHNMLAPGSGVVLGLSGGADSVCLLHFLKNLKSLGLKITCVHINHGLRGDEAARDAEFCAEFCRKQGVDFVVFNENAADQAAKAGQSTEEAGRFLRYTRFNQVLTQLNYNAIAVAHNKNDVAETVLMQIFRGAGVVKGIPPVNGKVVRPLIDVARKDILAYCRRHSLPYCDDSTNFQNEYVRNKIRNTLLPLLEQEFNPSAVDALARLAAVSSDENALLDNITKNIYETCVINGEIDIDLLEGHEPAIKRRVVRLALAKIFGTSLDISFKHTEAVMALLGKQSGKQAALPQGFAAVRVYNKICIEKPAPTQAFSVNLPKNKPIFITGLSKWFYLGKDIMQENAFTMALSCGKIGEVWVRSRQNGDVIYFETVGTKKVKDFFIDKKIPRHLRDQSVFVACQKDIILILDGPKSDKFKPEAGCDVVYLQIWEDNEQDGAI